MSKGSNSTRSIDKTIHIGKVGSKNSQLEVDKKIVQQLNTSEYDAVLYKVKDKLYEVLLPKYKVNGLTGKLATHDIFSKAGYAGRKDALSYYKSFFEGSTRASSELKADIRRGELLKLA